MKNLIITLIVLLFQHTYAQLDANGVLILNSGTTAEINAISPDTGALVYNIDTKKTYVYNGTSWEITSGTNNGILTEGKNQTMFGNTGTTGNCIVSHGIATFFTSTSDNNYIHIKLPYTIDTHNEMFHIKATGYRYGAGKVIDITWVGYCYKNGSALLSTSNVNNGSPEFSITQYIGSDNHIYLRFRGTTGSNYFQSFRVDSMNVGNGSVLAEGDIQIISSASANL